MNRNTRERTVFQEEMVVHYTDVYNYLYRLTRNESDAVDLTQDTYERAYRKIGQYQEGTHARAWLFRLAFNLFVNKYRKNQRRNEGAYDEREAYNRQDDSSGLTGFSDLRESGALDQDFSDPVHKALAMLTDEQRTILLMSDLYDFAEKEIAEFFGLNLNTTKGKIRRARLALIERLQGYADANFGIVNTRNLG